MLYIDRFLADNHYMPYHLNIYILTVGVSQLVKSSHTRSILV